VVIEQEMADPRTPDPVQQWAAHPPLWLEIMEPQQVEDIPSLGKPGARGDGDRAIISRARELGADVLIMDDRKARREAKKRGMASLWTLEVLDEAAERGFIDDLCERLELLVGRTPFYVVEKARAVIDDMKGRDRERKLARAQQTPEQGGGAESLRWFRINL
jgi:predicted nucleic acid-binding protein